MGWGQAGGTESGAVLSVGVRGRGQPVYIRSLIQWAATSLPG